MMPEMDLCQRYNRWRFDKVDEILTDIRRRLMHSTFSLPGIILKRSWILASLAISINRRLCHIGKDETRRYIRHE